MIKKICIYFFLLIIVINVIFSKENLYIFSVKNYVEIFPENTKINEVFKNNFNRKNFFIKEIKLNSLKTIQFEIDKIYLNNNNGIIFSDYLISPLVIKNENILNNKNIKLITYNLSENYKFEVSLPVINILLDSKILNQKLEKILEKYSNKKDLSDCGVYINSNYNLCNKFVNDFNKKGYKLLIFDSVNDANNLDLWLINNKNLKNIIFFGYNKNIQILDIKDEFKNYNYIEINSNYGRNLSYVKKNIQINWEKIIKYAIKEKIMNDFVNNYYLKKEVIDCIVKKEDAIIVR